MDDRALYQTILGLQAPWQVERVELRPEPGEVEVWVAAAAGTAFACPECDAAAPIHDHVERRWRHLDTCQFRTLLCARVPRLRSATHRVRTARVPWAEPGARFTALLERLTIAWLRESTPTAVARRLWDYTYVGAARTFFRRWYGWAMRSRLEPMKKVARMLPTHLDKILTYLTHRITNAVTEGLNAKIQWIKYSARGYRNRGAFKMAIYFHCGGLDLDPQGT